MTTAYTNLLGFALPVDGELDGTWGNVVNNSITELVEDAIAATATQSVASGDWTLTTTGSGAANQARCAILVPTGAPGVSRNIIAPSQSKAYVVHNQSDAAVVVKGSATTGTTIAAGARALVAWTGSDFVTVATSTADGVTSVSGTGTVQGLTLSGTVTSTGSLTLGGSLSAVSLTTQVSGTLPVGNGGTGATTLTGVVKGNGTSAFTAGSVNLASEVTGTLPIANGGTGATDAGTARSNLSVPSTTGSGASGSWGISVTGTAANVTGTVAVANGGTGLTSTPSNGQIDIGNGTGFTRATLTAGSGVSISNGAGSITISATGSGGTVTGVTASSPLASSGGTAPNISLTGTVPVANGGTGVTAAPSNGQLLIGNGTGYTQATLTAGSNISITNSSGGITIAATGASSYSQGWWTPALSASGASFTYTTQRGSYIRVGNMVTCFFDIVLSNRTGTTTGNTVVITGLPFTVDSWQVGSGVGYYSFLNYPTSYTQLGFDASGTEITLRRSGDNVTSATFAAGDIATNFAIRGSITYKVQANDAYLPGAVGATDQQAGPSTASFSVNSSGSYSYVGNVGGNSGTWLVGLGSGSNYEVRATLTSGSFTSGTAGSWLSLSTNRTWSVTDISGVGNQAVATLEIRDATTQLVYATSTMTLFAQNTI